MAPYSSYERQLERNVFLTQLAHPMPPTSRRVRSNSARKVLKVLDSYRIILSFREARSTTSLSSYAARSQSKSPSMIILLIPITTSTQALTQVRASPRSRLQTYQNRTISVFVILSTASFILAYINQGRNFVLFLLNSKSLGSFFITRTVVNSRTISLVIDVLGVRVLPLFYYSRSYCSRPSILQFYN